LSAIDSAGLSASVW